MKVGDLVRANERPSTRRLSFPQCFGVITKVHTTGQIVYVQWIDNLHNGSRPIHCVYLERICK